MTFDLVGKVVKDLRLPVTNYFDSPTKIFSAQEGDSNSRYINVTLFDKKDLDLSGFSEAILNATLPDGGKEFFKCEIKDNKVVGKLTASMLKTAGRVACDITLRGSDTNQEQVFLTTQTFYVMVAPSQYGNDAVEGDENYNVLLQIINEVNDLKTSLEAAENERSKREQERQRVFLQTKQNCENATNNANATIEALILPPDCTNANKVGVPKVSIDANKRFVFENLKGVQGLTGKTGANAVITWGINTQCVFSSVEWRIA